MLFPNICTLPPFKRIYYQSSYCDFVLHSDLETRALLQYGTSHILLSTRYYLDDET